MRKRAFGAIVAGLAVFPATAGATSRKVAIGNFQWSIPAVTINLGDTVTWYWVGPDTQHSVTGVSANDTQFNSDPGRTPSHSPGDRFSVKFTSPGSYQFQCVLHAIVRGSVTVEPIPGNGAPSPDPDPPILGDLTAPVVDGVSIRRRVVNYTLDDSGIVTIDLLKQRGKRWVYVSSRRYEGHVGYNEAHLSGHLASGNYKAFFRAADASNNQSKDAVTRFTVRH
jgi:plastocyanin